MGVDAKAVVEERVVAWITALLGQAGALEEQRDPDWRHAYGLAQGAGFILRNRQWPQFPSTSGSSFQRLVSEERDRRNRGEGPRPAEPINDPLTPLAAPDDDEETQASPHEGSAEQLMKGLVKQVQAFGPQDAAWRHAFGLAQGVGVLLSNGRWSIYPPVDGTVFTRLMAEERAARGGAPAAPTAPKAPGSGAHAAPRPPAPPLPPRPRPGQTGGFAKPVPPAPPAPPAAPRPAVPRAPAPPPPDAFRAMPTMLNEGEQEEEENQDDAFRAQRTMLEAVSGDVEEDDDAPPPAAPSSDMTMLQGEEDEEPAPPPAPSRAAAAGPSSAMPTFLQAEDEEEELAPPPSTGRSTSQPTVLTNDDDSGERTQVSASRGGSGSAGHGTSTVPDDSGRLPAPRMGAGTAPPPAPAKPPQRDPATGALRRAPPPSMREAMAGKQAAPQRRKEEAGEAEQLEKIGKFDILSRLGKGAMGQVFKGRGPDGAIVAIKVLHQHLGTSKRVRARFMREAKAVERIQHPNVVRFVETGEQPGVGQYIVMEFVDGKPLHDVLRDRKGAKFEIANATDLLLQTCRGLRAAHAAGVVHRDLKPENILLSNNGEMKITDFSLARREQDSMLLTRPGQVMGTPHFMSPEQAKGQAVDVRTDLYSLGALMYVLLTGQFPFPNGTVAEVIAAHCEKPRPDPRKLNPECTEPLANVCLKLMAIDRNERYPTVEALIEDLHSVLGLAPEKDEDDAPAGALPPGARVDEYTVERVLGAGGMGAVYRAKSAKDEAVALKVLPQQAGRDPQERIKDVRRFLNEAKLAKRVTSPHVYKVFKYGVDDGGQAFMAASLAEGTALREYVSKNGPLKPDQVMKVARGVCTALQAIHGAEVMHRDITPANIILGPDWQTKKDAAVCIIDFGLAIPLEKDKSGGPAEPTALFKHRVATKKDDEIDEEALYLDDLPGGTPAYMAPEVLEDPSLVDERADLYGLGSTLYFASTGHAPYSGDGIEAVLYQQKSQPPAPITQFNADFPEELSELIIQLLAHEPHTRPRSAKLCLSKLQRLEDPKAQSMAWKPESQPAVAALAPPPEPAGFQWSTFILGFVAGTVLMACAAFAMQLFK